MSSFNSLNEVILMGTLGRDPEVRHTGSGTSICNFSIAVSESFKQNDEWKEKTHWINIVAWQALADNCGKFLQKGSKCLVKGRLQVRDYEKKDGQKVTVTEVVAEAVKFLDSKPKSNSNKEFNQGLEKAQKAFDEDDDLPF